MFLISHIDFVKLFDDSKKAASLVGPKLSILFLFRLFINPLANGASGPTTTKSILFNLQYEIIRPLSRIFKSLQIANCLIPALPGIQ